MSPSDKTPPLSAFIQEEMIENACQRLAQYLVQFPPAVRLRLLAFLHLIECPQTTKASLKITRSGSVRLTLETAAGSCPPAAIKSPAHRAASASRTGDR